MMQETGTEKKDAFSYSFRDRQIVRSRGGIELENKYVKSIPRFAGLDFQLYHVSNFWVNDMNSNNNNDLTTQSRLGGTQPLNEVCH